MAIKKDTGLRSISLRKRLFEGGEVGMRLKTRVGCAVFINETDLARFWKPVILPSKHVPAECICDQQGKTVSCSHV